VNWKYRTYQLLAALVAVNYFAFRVELFEDEYRENHPQYSDLLSFTRPTLTWETFDKDNAPQAFVINVETSTHLLSVSPIEYYFNLQSLSDPQPVRDKSPPVPFSEY